MWGYCLKFYSCLPIETLTSITIVIIYDEARDIGGSKWLISEDLSLIDKLKQAAILRLEISGRTDKPNLEMDKAKALIAQLPSLAIGNPTIEIAPNLTKPYQPYYDIGRDEVFIIRYNLLIKRVWTAYYIKGFFFNREKIVGVYLISVRKL